MAQLPTGIYTHSRKVCSLYKKALRAIQDWQHDRTELRYECVLMRQRFEENRNIRDARVAKKLLLDGEEELFQRRHPSPIRFPNSPGGIAYDRVANTPDWVLDFWSPEEKSLYPKYFARREEMKKDYVEFYNKMYPEKPLEKAKK